MKIVVPPQIIKLANEVAKIPCLKKVLKPFYYCYKRKIDKNRNKQFIINGLSVLQLFDKTMRENGIPYSVFAGTLLGAVRERGFISHDMDIDTAVFYSDRPDNLSSMLCDRGFKLLHRFTIEDGKKGMEETYLKDNVTLDIFYIYSDSTADTYQCDFHAVKGTVSWEDSMKSYGYVGSRRLEFPVVHKFRRMPFSNITVSVIENYDQWLSCRYGSNYMIPDPGFHDDGNNQYIIDEWLKADYRKY